MNKLQFNNTYDKGMVTFLVLPDKDKYIGVCLEFDLEVRADTPEEAKEQIEDYAKLWHKNAVAHKLPEELLNRPAPKKYWKLYSDLLELDLKRIESDDSPSINISLPKIPTFRSQFSYPNYCFN